MTEQERQKLKVKTACCKDCGGWISQAAFPICESSKDSIKNFKEHVKAGDIIDVMTVGEAMLLSYCECYKLRDAEKAAAKAAKKAAKAGDLFTAAKA
jgi:exosome complex RNA-binding protein Csl4